LLDGNLIGLAVALLGGFICFTFNGVQLNMENKTIRSYTSYFGIKRGKTKDISAYPFICIFKSNKRYKMFGRANQSASYTKMTYDIYVAQ
jgi:hypothetical protein